MMHPQHPRPVQSDISIQELRRRGYCRTSRSNLTASRIDRKDWLQQLERRLHLTNLTHGIMDLAHHYRVTLSEDLITLPSLEALLIDRGHCKSAFATDSTGRPVVSRSDAACYWSALGAIGAVARNSYGAAIDMLYRHVGSVVIWNDAPERTGPEVSAAMRAAADAWERENNKEN